jgi:hypothetical protein
MGNFPQVWQHCQHNRETQTQVTHKSHNRAVIRGAIHQLLSIILKLRILVLLPVSTMPYVVMVKNYS